MIAKVLSFTIIRIGAPDQDGPYAVVLAETADGERRALRVDGDAAWLAVDGTIEIVDGAEGAQALPVASPGRV